MSIYSRKAVFIIFVFCLCVYMMCTHVMYVHACVCTCTFVSACKSMLNIWRRQHWIDLAFNLVRDWGLCCCLLLHILYLLVHKLITVFCSHLPSHHRVTASNRSTLLMPDFIWILRILPQILLRQGFFSVSLLSTSIYSLTFAEFHIFSAFFPFSCRTSHWFLSF